MDVVDKIAKAEKDEKDKPTTAITIDSIEVVKDYNFKILKTQKYSIHIRYCISFILILRLDC